LDANGPLELTGGARIEAVRKDPTSPLVRGFTAWALEGLARVYQTQSIFRAPCIEAATAQFWADTDPLTAFWETVDADDLREGISNGDLRRLYETWCEAEGARQFKGKAWAKACESRGLVQEHRGSAKTRARFWVLYQKTVKEQSKKPETAESEQNEQNKGYFQQNSQDVFKESRAKPKNRGESVHSVHFSENGAENDDDEVRI
jgi:hypothetical protein